MTFSPTDVILIIGAVSLGIVNIITALRTGRAVKVAEEVSAKADVIAHRVDGAATASVLKIEGLEKQIRELLVDKAEKKEIAALEAQRNNGKKEKP